MIPRLRALFVTGRILANILLVILAVAAGTWLSQLMSGGTGNVVISFAFIATGLWLLGSAKPYSPCGVVRPLCLQGFLFSLTPLLLLLPLISLLGKQLRDKREWLARQLRCGAAAVWIARDCAASFCSFEHNTQVCTMKRSCLLFAFLPFFAFAEETATSQE